MDFSCPQSNKLKVLRTSMMPCSRSWEEKQISSATRLHPSKPWLTILKSTRNFTQRTQNVKPLSSKSKMKREQREPLLRLPRLQRVSQLIFQKEPLLKRSMTRKQRNSSSNLFSRSSKNSKLNKRKKETRKRLQEKMTKKLKVFSRSQTLEMEDRLRSIYGIRPSLRSQLMCLSQQEPQPRWLMWK